MSDREKKLLLYFGLALFVLVNFFGVNWFIEKRREMDLKLGKAKTALSDAEIYAGNIDRVIDEQDWLREHLPPAKAQQTAQTELEQYASAQARMSKLEAKPKLLPADVKGPNFHRAKVEYKVEGMERDFYAWLDRLQDPERMRGVTFLRIEPKRDDDSKIESTVVVEQWYTPTDVNDVGAAPEPEEADVEVGEESSAPGLPPGLPVPGSDPAAAGPTVPGGPSVPVPVPVPQPAETPTEN